jgi:hypothetical protein
MNPLTAFERHERNEDALVQHMIDILQRKLERDYPVGATRRDAHPKHVALLRASFTVEPKLPPALRVGVFADGANYEAWVRFSNASGTPQSDAVRDVRGCAIKLLNVTGGGRVPESDEPDTQDFLLVSIPTMPLGTVKLFHDAIYYSIERARWQLVARFLLTGKLRVLKALDRARTRPTSPADIRYWSTTPYLLGPGQAVKYSLVPTSAHTSALPTPLTDTYLSDNLQQHLAQADVTFDFKVQLRTDPASMPIEDAGREWREEHAPFTKVATLRIANQAFRTAERDATAEALAFSPAHARVEHRPIGAVNRARMRIYKALADFRRRRDGRPVASR